MGTIWDHEQLGRTLRAARILAAYDHIGDAADAVTKRYDVPCSARSLAAIERGEQSPSLDLLSALLMLYRPVAGMAFLRAAIRQEWIDEYMAMIVGAPGLTGPPAGMSGGPPR